MKLFNIKGQIIFNEKDLESVELCQIRKSF